jgi:dTDP-4-amino-4,6-dideoxygalactose transaminase
MIKLFHINNHIIDTSSFTNLLHDKSVTLFEKAIAEYVGAEYAVGLNSATSAIFLLTKLFNPQVVTVPSMIPPVVPNALITGGADVMFNDDTHWIGGPYSLTDNIIDSAQAIYKNQFSDVCCADGCIVYSMYPTKPIGSCDGGIVATNDKKVYEALREMSMNGMSFSENNWDRKQSSIGYKMYMNSVQAAIAMNNYKRLEEKKDKLAAVRYRYNTAFGLNNTSEHLYRVNVDDNRDFINQANSNGIVCGIHYDTCHDKHIFGSYQALPKSEKERHTTVSIPFHEELNLAEINKVIEFTHARIKNN